MINQPEERPLSIGSAVQFTHGGERGRMLRTVSALPLASSERRRSETPVRAIRSRRRCLNPVREPEAAMRCGSPTRGRS